MGYALCGAVLLTVLLGGCGEQPTGGDVTTAPRPTQNTTPLINFTTAPTTEPIWETTEPTGETLPPPSLDPVTRLSGIQWQTVPQLLSLGDGAVLACRNDYQEGKGIVNYLEVLDVYEDTVLAQKTVSSPRELVEQQFQDGCFLLRDPENSSFELYDRELQRQKKFSAPNVEGYFSYDLANYYFVENKVLYRMDVASGNYGRITLDQDLRLESLIGVHPEWDIVVAKVYLSFYNETTGVCAINCKNGKLLLLNKEVSALWFEGENFYAAMTDHGVYGNNICYGTLSEGVKQKATSGELGSDTVSYSMLPGSSFMMLRTVDEKNLSTTVYDLSMYGICSRLSQYDYQTATLGSVYLKQEQLIFGVYPQEDLFLPVVIDPKVLKYEKSLSLHKEIWPALVDQNAIRDYQAEAEGPALPDSLDTLRRRADALEEKYGVSIRIENQTLGLCGSFASVEADPDRISQALTVLEEALALYPKGFLGQFQNGIGEGGLNFCLTGRLQGSLNPVGKTLKNGDRYDLALDITAEDLDRTVHHELWHAIEMELSTDSFDHPQWQNTNPQGFLYYGRYDGGYEKLTQWTYAESGSQCHFVDAYSRINAREDRARLMDTVMTTDATELLRSPALREKLQIMSKAIREHFDTKGWTTPHWERSL